MATLLAKVCPHRPFRCRLKLSIGNRNNLGLTALGPRDYVDTDADTDGLEALLVCPPQYTSAFSD
jgi:hypothetical protein